MRKKLSGSYPTVSASAISVPVMVFNVDDRMGLIDQQLLMMAGDIADAKYMPDSAFEKVANAKSKELILNDGAALMLLYPLKSGNIVCNRKKPDRT